MLKTEDRHESEEERHPNLVEVETPSRRRWCLVLTVVMVLCLIMIGGAVSAFLIKKSDDDFGDRSNPTVSLSTIVSRTQQTAPGLSNEDFEDRSTYPTTSKSTILSPIPQTASDEDFEDRSTYPTTSKSTIVSPQTAPETVTSHSWSEWSPWSPCNSTVCAVELSTRERVCEIRRGAARLSRQECDGGVSSQETRTCPFNCCTDCAEIHSTLRRADNGTYLIDPDGKGPFQVYCDMTTDGGGWTVFQRRQDGSEDFNRTWDEYKTGFGNLSGEFWLGNEYIYRIITAKRNRKLRVDMGKQMANYFAIYDNVSIGSERENYVFHVGSYRGGHTDSLLWYENGKMFSTFDRDNDGDSDNLAASIGGGWWYPGRHRFDARSPNGLYKSKLGWYRSEFHDITWCDFKIK